MKNVINHFRERKGQNGWLPLLAELLLAVYALADQSLTVLEADTECGIPVFRQLFILLGAVKGAELELVFIAAGLGAVFFLTREEKLHKNGWVRLLCAFFALTTVLGRSYFETGTWDYLFGGKLQFLLSLLVMAGYYFLYKNLLAMGAWLLRHWDGLVRTEPRGKLEAFLFGTHPFLMPFLAVVLLSVPYLISFFPGPVQADGFEQLWRYMGVIPMTNHHPIFSTKIMGKCLAIGREVFHSDNIGIFLYTFPSSIVQSLSFGYLFYMLHRLKAPMSLRWFTLFFLGVFPLFPIWGYTLVKDNAYYVCTLLLCLTFTDILTEAAQTRKGWRFAKRAFFFASAVGIGLMRNNGRYVVAISLVFMLLLYRKHWKLYLCAALGCFLSLFLVEGVYMQQNGIQNGSIREAMSIPLQQTARYERDHADEITEEEYQILSGLFEEFDSLGEVYDPELSDPVKALFCAYPTDEQLKSYIGVWFAQLCKHPDTYIQAFLHHTYGYFYPNREEAQDPPCVYRVLGRKQIKMEEFYMDVAFVPSLSGARILLEEYTNLTRRLPFIGLLYNAGTNTYVLLGCLAYLLVKKKRKEITLLIPSFSMLLVCLLSPVNGKVRYMLPIMVVLPLTVAWCRYVAKRD